MTAPTAPPADAQAAQQLATYQQSTDSLRYQLLLFIAALWHSLGEYRNDQMARFVREVVPVVNGAQQQMASLTAAFLAAQQSTALGTPFRPVAVDPKLVTGSAVRNGADPAEVYGRPFHLVWRQLADLPKQPGAIEQAIQSGLDRANQTALTDLQLTKTHTSRQVMARDSRVVAYRRVLEGAHSCGLCIVASTLRYHKKNLMPIHPACDCVPEPIYGDSDPGLVLDEQVLAGAHQAIADAFGKSDSGARIIPGQPGLRYRDVLITHEHGEIGPVLAVKGRPFTGPKDRG